MISRVSFLRHISSYSSLVPFSTMSYSSTLSPHPSRRFTLSSSLSAPEEQSTSSSIDMKPLKTNQKWKPMCLYYTQGKCTKMDDLTHLEKFNHDCSRELYATESKTMRSQQLDYFLVLDLEGKVEILEFPVLMIDAKNMNVVDLFHRFVRPSAMSERRINEYIEGKYGKLGVDRVWHDTAVTFNEVIQQFEAWMCQRHLWRKELDGRLNRAAFVTCGNWDLKTKVPQQCTVSGMEIPQYFMEWINLKDIYLNFYQRRVSTDIYLNFYQRRATGMLTMMKELQIPLVGSHHLGIDDTKNITRVLQHMVRDGALLQITARRNPDSPEKVQFLYKNRV